MSLVAIFREVRGFKLAHGRFLNAADDYAYRRVAVLGAGVLTALGATVGGIIGIGLGTPTLLHTQFGWDTVVDPSSILVAFATATATGVIFGVWPARRAARMDPMEALRSD